MPTVSILIPSYNHARYLRDCLESVLAQTYEDWEVVLVDDCSTDDSVAVAKAVTDPRIHVHQNAENLGTYGTLERALELSTGEYVAILNSDDLWLPEKLAAQVAVLQRVPDARFAYTLGRQVGPDGDLLEVDQHKEWPTTEVQELLPYLLRENRILASSVLFRREGLRFHTECRYSGDWVALLERASLSPVACVAQPLTHWRVHDGNTHRRSPGQLEEEIWVREGIRDRKWSKKGVPLLQIRQSLAQNQMHLAALYVLAGSIHSARLAAIRGLGLKPAVDTAKRVAATHLPTKVAKRRLWPTESAPPESDPRKPLAWF